jgi:ABC-type Fe3+ transport system permease subunit
LLGMNIFMLLLEPKSALIRLIIIGIMWGFEKDKERERYYLLPGQGGRSARRKHRRILLWSIVVGLFASAFFVGVIYLITNTVR